MRYAHLAVSILFLFVAIPSSASDSPGEVARENGASCARPVETKSAGSGCGASQDASDTARKGETPPPSCGSAAPDLSKGGCRILGNSDRLEIPFELLNEHVVIPVSINGSEPFRLVLDTGMPFYGATLNPSPRTDALELENPDNLSVMVAGMEDYTPRVGSGVTLGLPGVELTDQVVTVIPLPGCAETESLIESEGVIGLSVFDNFVVQIDYDERIVTLTRPDKFVYDRTGVEIPIRLGPVRMPEVVFAMETEDGQRVPVGLVVDTGAALAMTITLKPDDALELPDGAKDLVVGYSSWGEVKGKLARVPALSLGDVTLDDVLVTFFEQGAPGVPPCGENGLLGSEVLQRFTVTFDYAGERMFLEPGRQFEEPFEFNMTGIAFRRAEDGTFEIVRVFPDTPASEVGIEEGDIILSVNGVLSRDYTDDLMREAMRSRASALKLRIARGSDRMDVSISPRRLI